MHWLIPHIQWLFDVLKLALGWKKAGNPPGALATLTAQGGKVVDAAVASGTNISQTINSPTTFNLTLPVAPASGTPVRERYDEWREIIREVRESIDQMWYAFVPSYTRRAAGERGDYEAGICRGNRALHDALLVAEPLQNSGLIKDWNELIQYTHAVRVPPDSWLDCPTMGKFDTKARAFEEKLMQIAREDMNAAAQSNGEAADLNGLAWNLRDYADSEKRKEPNTFAFSRSNLERELGKDAPHFREVIGFMEKKGWAVKAQRLPDCWHIN